MGNPHTGKLKPNKDYSPMYLINTLAYMSKRNGKKLVKRILSLSLEKRRIFIDDIVTAMENRLKVLEGREERL